jgi:hypothetical protein
MLLQKTLSLSERVHLQFRAESYNLFNRVQLGQPGNLTSDPGTFGQSTSVLKGRVPTREPQQLAEKSIVENAIAGANRGFTVLERVPCNSDARLKVVPVVVVQRRQAAFLLPSDREGERCLPAGVDKQRRKQVVHFVGDAVKLVAQPVVQSEVGQDFERVLRECIEVLLAEPPEIISGTIAALTKGYFG